MKKIFIYSLFAATLLFSACSTDLDVNGKYKETMVVYGLLDQSKTTQYIKINKAFLGEGSALDFAKVKDSSQYSYPLNVKIKRLSDGMEFILLANNTIPKDAGIFYAPDQTNAIYSFSTPVNTVPNLSTPYLYDSIYTNTILKDGNYQLIIKNSETGNVVTAQTALVKDFIFTKPGSGIPSFGFVSASNPNQKFFVEWITAKNGRAYQLIIRLNYMDYLDKNADNIVDDSIAKTLDWVFPTKKSGGLDGTETMGNDFEGKDFLRFIGTRLDAYPTLVRRVAGNVNLIVVAAADDLNTFIEVNAPSTGIIQEKPEFTNITNGIGIFSSRYYKPPFSKIMAAVTLDTLACGQFTKNLKFVNAQGQLNSFGQPITCP